MLVCSWMVFYYHKYCSTYSSIQEKRLLPLPFTLEPPLFGCCLMLMIFTGLTALHGTLIYHTFMQTIGWIFIPLLGTSLSLVLVCHLLCSCSCSSDLEALAFFPRGVERILYTRKYLLLAVSNCKGTYSINTFTTFAILYSIYCPKVNSSFGRYLYYTITAIPIWWSQKKKKKKEEHCTRTSNFQCLVYHFMSPIFLCFLITTLVI